MKYVPPKDQAALGENGQYKDVDMIIGEPGSIVPAIAIEMLLREMHNTIKLTGLIPSETDLTQLYTALTNFGMEWSPTKNYHNMTLVVGSDNTLYKLLKPSGPDIKDGDDTSITVGPKDPISNADYWVRFNTFKASDVAHLDTAIAEILDTIDGLSTKIDSLASVHTSTGLATTNKAGHVIPGKTVTLDGGTGTINVKVDAETIRSKPDGTLYAEVPTSLTSETPLTIDNDVIRLGIDNNTLIIKNNKLVVNPAILSDDDGDGNPITINGTLLNELNRLRMLSIGRPIYHTSIDLPDDHVWVDGSFISFEDRPEFARRYSDGAFNGMLLEWNATEEDIDKNPGKFRKNAANPTGLYLPKNGGDFYRLWNSTVTDVTAGSKNKAGLPNITGNTANGFWSNAGEPSGAFYRSTGFTYPLSATGGIETIHVKFDASLSNSIYGSSTTVMPESTNIPVIMYLGKTEALNEVFYNNGTQQLPIATGSDLGVIKVDNNQFTVDKYGTLHLNRYAPTITDPVTETLTTSGTYTVPLSGWYEVICIGGGGAGGTNSGVGDLTKPGFGGYQGGSTIFGNYITAIGGSGGAGCNFPTHGSGGGGCGEIITQKLFLTRDEKIEYTIGEGGVFGIINQEGVGLYGGKNRLNVNGYGSGTGATGAEDGFRPDVDGVGIYGGKGGDGAPSPYGYGAGGGGAAGNGHTNNAYGGGSGGKPGSPLAEAGEDGMNGSMPQASRRGGGGAPGAIIINRLSTLQGSIATNSVPTQEVITTDTTYTPETDGWYELIIIGGGGGGGADPGNIVSAISGGGGGSGEYKRVYKKLSKFKPISISIGRGGVGATIDTEAEDGFPTTVTIGGEIITAEGGHRGIRYLGGQGGGSGYTAGLAGHNGSVNTYGDGNSVINAPGGIGGGNNSGFTTYFVGDDGPTILKVNATGYGSGGGGGWGGNSSNPLRSGGSNGCHGAVIIKKLVAGGGSGTAVDVDIATTEDAGIVKPDGKTINIDATGTISVPDVTTIQTFTPYKETITTSGTWTCPKDGWFKVTAIGAGGAGGGLNCRGGLGGGTTSFGSHLSALGGGGGGGGGGVIDYAGGGGGGAAGRVEVGFVYLTSGQTVVVTIGAGGSTSTTPGTLPTGDGSRSDQTINTTTYYVFGLGARGASNGQLGEIDSGGLFLSAGGHGGDNGTMFGGGGGGSGGAGPSPGRGCSGTGGGNGGNGEDTRALTSNGGTGGDGAIIIEYISASSSPMDSDLLNEFNKLRKLSIGRPVYHTSSTLPEDHAWCDGSFVSFTDRPELRIKYEEGGFEGLVLPWDADNSTIAANKGKFRPDAEVPTGLFMPTDGSLFYKAWHEGSTDLIGGYNEAGLPNITGNIQAKTDPTTTFLGDEQVTSTGALTAIWAGNKGGVPGDSPNSWGFNALEFDASKSNTIYGNSDTVMPESVNKPVIIYLGRTTAEDILFYNPETTGAIRSATPTTLGVVKPDNKTIAADDNGQLFSRILPPLLLTLEWTYGKTELGYLNLTEDHGLLKRSDYKDGWNKISELDPTLVLDDEAWLAELATNGWVNKYSSGDGVTTFRVPYWSKEYVSTMTPGAVKSVGDTVIDEMRPITGATGSVYSYQAPNTWSGALLHYSGGGGVTGGYSGGCRSIQLDSSKLGDNYAGDVTHGPGAILYPQLRIKNYVEDRATIEPSNEVYVRHDHALLDTFFNPLTIMPGCLDMSKDHGLLSRDTYINAWKMIEEQAGTSLITDAEWLAEVAANGVCAKFSSGNGATTFRIPYIKRMYIRATGDSTVSGDHLEAGLPNITGVFNKNSTKNAVAFGDGDVVSGAFTASIPTTTKNTMGASAGKYIGGDLVFDASLSNSIYGNSDTVVPESICWIPWIKMYGVITNPNDIDINGLLEERVKLNSSFGFPSSQYVDIPIAASGMTYKASENGWITVLASTNGTNGWVKLTELSTTRNTGVTYPTINATLHTELVVSKGQSVQIDYSGCTISILRFIPAISHNPSTPLPLEEEATSDYTLEESYTGKRWIDGKKIYRRGHQWSSVQTFAANTWVTTPIPKANIKTIIDCKGMTTLTTISSGARNTYSASNFICGNGDPIDPNNLRIWTIGVPTFTDTIVIEYTKVDENI